MYNKYPYTDFHELNLDWVLSELRRLQNAMTGLLEEAVSQATEAAENYFDEHIAQLEADFNAVVVEVNNLRSDYESDFSQLNNIVDTFINNFTIELNNLKRYVDDSLNSFGLQMQLMIQQNNEYLLNAMDSYLSQIKVINYFTGEKVTIQDMFNYLAMLHLNDSIDYDTMALRSKTYTEFANMNITFSNLAAHGNTLYV